MERIAADLRDHYWYDELVQRTLEALEAYLAERGQEHDPPARTDYLGEPAS
jgi:hypothetical protein